MSFPKHIKELVLAKSGRRCCICLKFKGVNVEVHHIEQEAFSHDNSIDNAIALCFDCHADVGHFNSLHPKGNKYSSFELKLHRDRLWKLIEEGKILDEKSLDQQYLEFIKRAFDRPAFNTPFKEEGRIENITKAFQDTILAMNTGLLRTRDNQIIQDIGFGKSSVMFEKWKHSLSDIEVKLQNFIVKMNVGLSSGKLKTCHENCYCGDYDYMAMLDRLRSEIIETLNAILKEANISLIINKILLRGKNGA